MYDYLEDLEFVFNYRQFWREPQFDKHGNLINEFELETRRDKILRAKREIKTIG